MPFRKSGPEETLALKACLTEIVRYASTGYVADDKGEPILPEGMRKLLESDLNRTFEF